MIRPKNENIFHYTHDMYIFRLGLSWRLSSAGHSFASPPSRYTHTTPFNTVDDPLLLYYLLGDDDVMLFNLYSSDRYQMIVVREARFPCESSSFDQHRRVRIALQPLPR